MAWLFGGVVLAGLALRPSFGDELVVTRYVGYVMPWLLVALLPLAAWAWAARRRALSAVLGLSAAIIIGIHAPIFWRDAPERPASERTIEVMSYNTWSRNSDARRIASVILRERPDLLLLQEIPPDVFDDLMRALRELYGGARPHSLYDPNIKQAVVSRFPLEPRASMKAKGQAQHLVVRTDLGAITVFNVHPLRTGGWRLRYGQIAALLEEDVLPQRSPVILGGDLNVTEHSQLYALVSGHLRNAHDAAGRGFGFTFPASGVRLLGVPALPLARIDHVFFSDHLVARRAGTLEDSGGSDHRPVFAELALREPPPEAPGGGVPAAPARDSVHAGRELAPATREASAAPGPTPR